MKLDQSLELGTYEQLVLPFLVLLDCMLAISFMMKLYFFNFITTKFSQL